MPDPSVLPTELTTAGAAVLIGSAFIKLVEKWLDKPLNDEHTSLRKELREELNIVKKELEALREEVDEWREKYYNQVETTNELLFEVSVLKTRLRKYETDTGEFNVEDF